MARPRNDSDECRRRAVHEVLERERKIPDVARDLGIGSPETLRNWVRHAERTAGSIRVRRPRSSPRPRPCVRRWPTSSARSRSSRRRPLLSSGKPNADRGDDRVHRSAPLPVAGWDVRGARVCRADPLRGEASLGRDSVDQCRRAHISSKWCSHLSGLYRSLRWHRYRRAGEAISRTTSMIGIHQ
jgi:transposase-like protein